MAWPCKSCSRPIRDDKDKLEHIYVGEKEKMEHVSVEEYLILKYGKEVKGEKDESKLSD